MDERDKQRALKEVTRQIKSAQNALEQAKRNLARVMDNDLGNGSSYIDPFSNLTRASQQLSDAETSLSKNIFPG